MTPEETDQIMLMLVSAYPAWKPSSETIALYESVLSPLPVEAAREAAMRILRSDREFAPPAGVIWTEAVELIAEAEGRPRISAEIAWGEVNEAISSQGHYRTPHFSIPAIARAVEAIGWREICLNENIEATRAHFFRIFESQQKRDFEHTSLLLGSRDSGGFLTFVGEVAKRIGGPK